MTSHALARLDAPAPFRLWRATLSETPPADAVAALSPQERARAARFVFERDRRRYLAAHCALRALLAEQTGVAPHLIAYREGPFGKPGLAPGLPACSFNMSHSEDTAVIAIAPEGEIGVDLEMLRAMPDAHALAERNFTPAERSELAATAAALQHVAFLRGWTRKEACLKAIGAGLSIAPESIDVGLGQQARLAAVRAASGEAQVQVWSLHFDENLVCALAHMVYSTIALHSERT